MLIEPTESESLDELNRQVSFTLGADWKSEDSVRFCDAMISIRAEVDDIVSDIVGKL